MTGTSPSLGFAWAGYGGLSAAASLLALLAFLLGALAGGELAIRRGAHRGRHLAAACGSCLVVLLATLVIAAASQLVRRITSVAAILGGALIGGQPPLAPFR